MSATAVAGATPNRLPRETMQFRPLTGSSRSCPERSIRYSPTPGRSVTLHPPNSGSKTPCITLGPSILSVKSVSSIDLTRSYAGLVLVSVVLSPQDLTEMRAGMESDDRPSFAVVILGQILSLPSGLQLSEIGKDGRFQIAGGLSTADRRPAEIGQVLRSHISNDRKVPTDL